MESMFIKSRINRKKIIPVRNMLFLLSIGILYIAIVFFVPEIEDKARKLIVLIMLAIVSFIDIREQKVPLTSCVVILGINVIHSILVFFSMTSWFISIGLFLLLLVIFIINNNLIGLGDIFLIALCVQSLMPENILKFLFLTFTVSSFIGLTKGLITKNISNITVPLSPCIAVSFALFIC